MSGSKRSSVRRICTGVAEAQACGEHDVGNGTGRPYVARSKPQNSSGRRPPNSSAASSTACATCCASATNPYRINPAAINALSCGHTEPL